MIRFSLLHFSKAAAFGCCIFLCACASQKNNFVGRNVQHLTARYNYLYNANLQMDAVKTQLREQPILVDREQFLPLHPQPSHGLDLAPLEKVIRNARLIITEKPDSRSVANAYALLAEAYLYKGQFFLAREYYDYVIATYADHERLYFEALAGRLHCLTQMQDAELATAITVVDSTLAGKKKIPAALYISLAEARMSLQQYPKATTALETALKHAPDRYQSVRIRYVLGQRYQKDGANLLALQQFKKLLYANNNEALQVAAQLQVMHLEQALGQRTDETAALSAMLAQDKYQSQRPQLYGQLAQVYETTGNYQQALNNYQQAIAFADDENRGLAHLALSKFLVSQKSFPAAVSHLDSARTHLPSAYTANYPLLAREAQIRYLASQYNIIATEDSLQYLSSLSPEERNARLKPRTQNTAPASPIREIDRPSGNKEFYFSNPAAIAAGLADFKRQWGNRKAEDNWRQAAVAASAGNQSAETGVLSDPDAVSTPQAKSIANSNLPLSKAALAQSNEKILSALLSLGSYYAVVAQDQTEAANIDSVIAHRFPGFKPNPDATTTNLAENRRFEAGYLDYLRERRNSRNDDPAEGLPNLTSSTNTLSAASSVEVSTAPINQVPVITDGIFSNAPATPYYFVIDVKDVSINLTPVRFRIGQFNRGSRPEQPLRHQLKEFTDDQLIYVGNFSNFGEVKAYADELVPLLPAMMKLGENAYQGFIVSKENFDKIDNKELLNRYLEFYNHNYLK